MNNGKTYARKIIFGLLFITGLIFTLLFARGCHAGEIQKDLTIEALSSVLKKSYDKNGIETAEKRLIMLNYKDLKNLHATDSSEIGRLQKLVNKKTISATIVKTATTGTLTGNSVTVTFGNKNDSLPKITSGPSDAFGFPCDTIYPTYADTLKDAWTDMAVTASKDSISVQYSTRNEFEFTQSYKKEGGWPFRKEVPIVTARSLNPHTTTTGISSYAVPVPNNKKRNAAFGALALAIGFVTGVFLTR